MATENLGEVGMPGDITKSQSGYGVGLRERVDLEGVGGTPSPTGIHHKLVGIMFIRLVEYHEAMRCHHLVDIELVIDLTRGIVGIAEPENGILLFHLVDGWAASLKELTGIFVLAERRSGDDRLHIERLCDEVDGLGGAIGDNHLFWGYVMSLGDHLFQRPCLGLRVVIKDTMTGCQICKQLVVVGGGADVRREVAADVAVFVGIVTVAFNHGLGGFRRFFPYPHIF